MDTFIVRSFILIGVKEENSPIGVYCFLLCPHLDTKLFLCQAFIHVRAILLHSDELILLCLYDITV